ncbi:CGNR zinc finger domain-containing protein [Streptomyces sp. NPDC090108]|uniref:CGNR zinc finger domain-containing protein n=1 Tax=Streptomyces sp. NPDC090108 TaxID=3365947 RepID=UPI0038045164
MALAAATDPYELRFDAGRICLDLLATAYPSERLDGVDPLRAWITGAGLVPARTPLGHADASWPVRFRELRDDIGRLVRDSAAADPVPCASALGRVNETAYAAPPVPRAVRERDGTLVRELAGAPACAALLAVVARDAVELLTDPVARAAVRQCEGDNCPLVYLDTSRGRRRRWCSSEVCGNRERVARHRRRAALARA